MKKIVLAIDSFKGSLTSQEAEQAAAEGILQVYPACEILQIPIADGGEGLLDTLLPYLQGHSISLYAHNPLMELIETCYGIASDGQTAIIEMATISGLPLIPPSKRNPFEATSFGTGELIKDALDKGCRNFIIGLGGSATNDAGLGMLQALGYRFFNKQGEELGLGGKIMKEVASIDTKSIHPALEEAFFTIVCDVINPFCGPKGAAYVYAPQKGADEAMVKELDAGMASLASVIRKTTDRDIAVCPGAGAAGGMAGAFLAFTNCLLKSGIHLVLEMLSFSRRIKNADLIITGEGRIDRQSAMGKVPYGVLTKAQEQDIPVIAIAGSIEEVNYLNQAGFQAVFSITPAPLSLQEAMEPIVARQNIRGLVSQICRVIEINPRVISSSPSHSKFSSFKKR
ncbi:glycerate kinase [Parabacteroides pacaensis]|uniref:glycerate kinase n=1 Tax=Parabacteroides pacaensis TaxID=2086575 RepID=UPI000D108FCC|nr:glycerate kinase [Parabacteroides pacaensis]